MKIALLSGAYKNAGDFLIVDRCKQLLNFFVSNSDIVEYERRKRLDDQIDEINGCDLLVLGGGPAYREDLYPGIMPLTANLDRIKIPIFAMALGWKGVSDFPEALYDIRFQKSSLQLLQRIENDGFALGCRDFFSERVLWKNGIQHTAMTGCAAWYDLNHVEERELVSKGKICKIYMSEPANAKFFAQFLDVISFLRIRFPSAEIRVLFHRGFQSDEFTPKKDAERIENLCDNLIKMEIPYEDISYSCDGFKRYHECDIHIGYRVHAHIYNLSQRRRTILIEEDGRGAGINQALGLHQIRAYATYRKIENRFIRNEMKVLNLYDNSSVYVINEIADYLTELKRNNYAQFEWAFERMQYYFLEMKKHLESINSH